MLSLLLLAAALVLPPPRHRIARSSDNPQTTPRAGPLASAWGKAREKFSQSRATNPIGVAADIELFAVCLESGLSTYQAAAVVAQVAGADTADHWRNVVALIGVGAAEHSAWEPMRSDAHLKELATLVVLSGQSGAAIATGCRRLTRSLRAEATSHATAAAERAGVFIALPLAVCFLPAFIVLGLIPVIISLGMQLM